MNDFISDDAAPNQKISSGYMKSNISRQKHIMLHVCYVIL